MNVLKGTRKQHTTVTCMIAEQLFGWRWMAYHSIPIRGTPGYPKKCLVRYFFPPERIQPEYLPATMDEPLDYAYCSSRGHDVPPSFSSDDNAVRVMEAELKKRGLFEKYVTELKAIIDSVELSDLWMASPMDKCLAALAVIDPKFPRGEP